MPAGGHEPLAGVRHASPHGRLGQRMFLYALSYGNPYEPTQHCVLFLAAKRPLSGTEALQLGIEAVSDDSLGNEWVEAVAHGTICGPLEVDGKLAQPSIAVMVD